MDGRKEGLLKNIKYMDASSTEKNKHYQEKYSTKSEIEE